MLNPKTVGGLIANQRKTLKLTQEQLGAILGVTGQAVSKWEQGLSLPDAAILPAVCRALNISGDTLLGLENHSENASDKASDRAEYKRAIQKKVEEGIQDGMRDLISSSFRISAYGSLLVLFFGAVIILRQLLSGFPPSYFVAATGGLAVILIVGRLGRKHG